MSHFDLSLWLLIAGGLLGGLAQLFAARLWVAMTIASVGTALVVASVLVLP